MLRTGDPADVVVVIEVDACFALILRKDLKAIVVDEDAGCATIQLVMADGSFQRVDCWDDDRL